MVTEVDVHALAAAHADGSIVIDVREPYEYVSGHVPGARLIPPDAMADYAAGLPEGEPVYVICASGNRSRSAALLLGALGVDAVSVAGGTGGWVSAGFPVVTGPHENAT
ncbi:rhodanese-like domain-containing protein [Acidiferrimicrobium sp. IK]|uniref:rhodanese-like domain-containing protein n=1 Tax=Acidiferrimicrobium sp. IK TaxID=2871700 RepID=UPI0021CB8C23|nr:rhodanese-like domain-containing protein [Acidiferrimicrobium sp. IK]MCU4185235.1 rhodanese-like domain-containing protein [Acidiferrimicrobium sp. IK]